MISAGPNPALEAFVARIAPEMVIAQVLLRRSSEGFELRHVADREAVSLRRVSLNELRELAQFTAHKQFRPLKSAPSLQQGWHCAARNPPELELALQCVYPGALADWFAVQQPNAPITPYREFTARQTGMYRITTRLTDEQVTRLARAGCHRRFCLKQRLWRAEGLSAESLAEKSLIPCLEPCAVLLEFGRAVARMEEQEKQSLALAPEEIETLRAALEHAVQTPSSEGREADFGARDNPRRLQWLLNKVEALGGKERCI